MQEFCFGAGVGVEDEGAQGVLEGVEVAVQGFGADGVWNCEVLCGVVNGCLQFVPDFFLFGAGFVALVGDEFAGFLDEFLVAAFFCGGVDEEGWDAPEGESGVEFFGDFVEAVEAVLGDDFAFEIFGEFGESAWSDCEELLNGVFEAFDLAFAGVEAESLTEVFDPVGVVVLQVLPDALFVDEVEVSEAALVGGVVEANQDDDEAVMVFGAVAVAVPGEAVFLVNPVFA